MSEENERLIQEKLRSPRSAAVAGILFSILTFISMFLMFEVSEATAADINSEWLERWSNAASWVLTLVPFAGIAFLWFTGVIRDWLGDREDRLFATIFLGSSLILIAMMFTWSVIVGAIFGTYAASVSVLDDDIILFGLKIMNEILGNYVLRMAGVFMFSIGSLWTKTGVAPRWLIIVTYIVALGFLFFAVLIREARFIFPIWVFVVSIYILISNYRQSTDKKSKVIS